VSQKLNVNPAELRASAGACDDIARDMKDPADKAVQEAQTSGGSLTGWSIGPALTELATSWKPALDGLHSRVQAGGDNLRATAKSHDWNENRVEKDFEKTNSDAVTSDFG
jgi:uncharacterized protein YukE